MRPIAALRCIPVPCVDVCNAPPQLKYSSSTDNQEASVYGKRMADLVCAAWAVVVMATRSTQP
jgi:hypothetical protein